jgi:hypothetical protein
VSDHSDEGDGDEEDAGSDHGTAFPVDDAPDADPGESNEFEEAGDPEAGHEEAFEFDAAGDPEGSGGPVGNGDADREAPLGDLAEEVERRRAEADDDVPMDELFEDSDVEGFDREALWRQVAGEDAAEQVVDDASPTDTAAATPTIEDSAEVSESSPPPVPGTQSSDDEGADRAERVVEKRSYCQGCEYFSAPPEVHCTHQGTEILEAVDMEHFRVVDCPVVAEDEELENV